MNDKGFEAAIGVQKKLKNVYFLKLVNSFRSSDIDEHYKERVNIIANDVSVGDLYSFLSTSNVVNIIVKYSKEDLNNVIKQKLDELDVIENSEKIYKELKEKEKIENERKEVEEEFNSAFEVYEENKVEEKRLEEQYKDIEKFKALSAAEKKHFIQFMIRKDELKEFNGFDDANDDEDHSFEDGCDHDCEHCDINELIKKNGQHFSSTLDSILGITASSPVINTPNNLTPIEKMFLDGAKTAAMRNHRIMLINSYRDMAGIR